VIATAKTVLWTGLMGVFEFEAFASGTKGVMVAVVVATGGGANTIIGHCNLLQEVWDCRQGHLCQHGWRCKPRAPGRKDVAALTDA